MEIKVKLHTITIMDNESGKSCKVNTLRSAEEIAGYIEESEKDEIVGRLEHEVCEVLKKQ